MIEPGWNWRGWLRLQSWRLAVFTAVCLALGRSTNLLAQGSTTAAIRGTVTSGDGAPVDAALVRVVNLSTGYAAEARVRRGNFLVQGLETGGPYRVLVRSLGHSPYVLGGLTLVLGETRAIDVVLIPVATQLDTIRVTADDNARGVTSSGGAGTSISDSSLRRLPTLNRDMYDFVRLVPQVGTAFGITGGGSNFRFNSYVIDGVSDRQLQGNNVLGPGTTGGKTISLEAVKEYQVLLTPYDAKYGDFTGLVINAVTRSGTNHLRGSAYGYLRNEQLARSNSFVGSSPYRREQFGFSLGGPIVRDRIHFFIAPEFQHASAPAPGPYISRDGVASPGLTTKVEDVNRFASILRAAGLEPGDGGRVTALNPNVTLFARVDMTLPRWRSRVVLRNNYSTVDATRFARPEDIPVFPLSSNGATLRTSKQTTALQIFTQASAASFNEFVLSYMDRPIGLSKYVASPFIQAGVSSSGSAPTSTLIAGPPPGAAGGGAEQVSIDIADHLVFQPDARHTLGVGLHVELFRYRRVGVGGSFGQWRFSSLDALESGNAAFYSITRNLDGGNARLNGAQPSAYLTDEWRVHDRLSLTVGFRAEMLRLSTRPAYNPAVDSVLGRRTSDYPDSRLLFSPRIGFSWNPSRGSRTTVRGGAGMFSGRPPVGWLIGPVRSTGATVRTLTCSTQLGSGVPTFIADPLQQPDGCPDGRGFSDGPVALIDGNLKSAQSFRSSLAIDRTLPWRMNATIEGLYTRVRSDFIFVNANLSGPQGIDAHGRVMYGRLTATGRAEPALVGNGRFPEVIDLRNHSGGHSWSVTAQLHKPFANRLELRSAYTYSRVRDVQSLTHGSAVAPFDIWASGRPFSGRHDSRSTGVSSFETPHRVILAATYAAPWKRWKSDFSVYYVGESGAPFTFGDSTAGGLGDLNADGTSANDPIYVPRDATDPAEIVFGGSDASAQAEAFERFIMITPCLRAQRGAIVARNSCRSPWVHTSNASLRQSLQAIRGHDIALQVEVFNLLNLLSPSWGRFKTANRNILQHVGQTSGAQPIFHFDDAHAGMNTQNLESGYQLQFSLRYSF